VRGQRTRNARRAGRAFNRRATAENRFEMGWRDMPRAQDDRLAARTIDDGRLDADLARSTIENERNPVAEFFRTCAAVVGLMRPKRLADGAAMPAWSPATAAKRRNSSSATGWPGTRRPTVSWPPVTASGTQARFFRISVSGPGQKVSISSQATVGTCSDQWSTAS